MNQLHSGTPTGHDGPRPAEIDTHQVTWVHLRKSASLVWHFACAPDELTFFFPPYTQKLTFWHPEALFQCSVHDCASIPALPWPPQVGPGGLQLPVFVVPAPLLSMRHRSRLYEAQFEWTVAHQPRLKAGKQSRRGQTGSSKAPLQVHDATETA